MQPGSFDGRVAIVTGGTEPKRLDDQVARIAGALRDSTGVGSVP